MTRVRLHVTAGFFLGSLCALTAAGACAEALQPSVADLQSLSLEDLGNVRVTSVSKRPEALSQAATAIYVISAEDIRRSGATSLPEALRLAPNLEVARINAYAWTVTARGFNSPETANKLLVLVNGRTVYEPIGSGVLWQQVDIDLPNIDHIEVISGPGGTMWGANAVNGVINVITKGMAASSGLSVQTTAGTQDRTVGLRYGGTIGEHIHYKLLADSFNYDATDPATAGDLSHDAFSGSYVGAGLTGEWGRDTYTLGASGYRNAIADHGGAFTGQTIRAGWTRGFANSSSLDAKTYLSRDVRDEPTLYESRDLFSLEMQHTLAPGRRHTVVWGGEFRYWWENFNSFNDFHFADAKTTISLGALFVQDEIALKPDIKLTVGLKGETNSYSGFEWLPSVRVAWQPDGNSVVWGAVSRAVRTPNRIERELEHPIYLKPSPDFQSEKLTAIEAGWRVQDASLWSVSLSAYYNLYDDLRTDGITPIYVLPFVLENGGRGTTYGLDAWGRYAVTPAWHLSGGFNLLHKKFKIKPGYVDVTALSVQGQDPSWQAQIRSQWDVTDRLEFDVGLRSVGKVDTAPVPGYTEADMHIGWQVREHVQLALAGTNLLHKRHIEVWDPSTTDPRYIGRSVYASLRVDF